MIAGGGVGAMEALLALQALAHGVFTITVVAANERFVLPALTVAEPFAPEHAAIGPLADIVRAEGAELHRADVVAVEAGARTVTCADGARLSYDYLVLAPGAQRRAPYQHAITFGVGEDDGLRGLLADLEHGFGGRVVFVVPDGPVWPLPLYELALMTAAWARDASRSVELSLITSEPAALGVFGAEASRAVTALLAAAGVGLHCGVSAAVGVGSVHLADGTALSAHQVVTQPVLAGPRLRGVPADAHGFIPADARGRVPGLQGVYAVGDATIGPLKQGGLACQQADAVAGHIASLVGAAPEPRPDPTVLRGRLMTGQQDRFLEHAVGEQRSRQAVEPLWWPPTKVAGRYLGPWLAARERESPSATVPAPAEAISVEIPSTPWWLSRQEALGLDSLGRMR